uniref:Uncharacterized protein n=1 Tax=Anopheles arabiensis TaxID=7173 RepID=A0A182I0Y8_ANOAR
RLQHCLKGAALDAVGHLLLFPGGLSEVISTLKARYGRSDLIVDRAVESVKRLPVPRMEKLDTIVEFGFAVKRLIATVQVSGLVGYMYDVVLLKELTRKLPPVLCIEWARLRKRSHEVNIFLFGRWIGELAGDLCGVIDMPDTDVGKGIHQARPNQQQPPRTTAGPSYRSGMGRPSNAYCNTNVVQVDRSTGNSLVDLSSSVCIVVLHGPKANVETYAFFDDGSTSTFMDHDLLEELGLKGTPRPLCIQWTGNVTREEHDSVQVAVHISGKQKKTAP